mgnify:CR=1 FL=1
MEQELANHLLTVGARFGAIRKLEESTVGRLCASDARFFSRIREGQTFTIKKYDRVMAWFVDQWPEFSEWPANVPRPLAPTEAEQVA